jgi:hypothetical protein
MAARVTSVRTGKTMRAETKKPLILLQEINGFKFGCGDRI